MHIEEGYYHNRRAKGHRRTHSRGIHGGSDCSGSVHVLGLRVQHHAGLRSARFDIQTRERRGRGKKKKKDTTEGPAAVMTGTAAA